jgi:hypothetical protein
MHKIVELIQLRIHGKPAGFLARKSENCQRVCPRNGDLCSGAPDGNQLVLEASDQCFGKGRIGLGSFDDLGAFRNIVVTPAVAAVAVVASRVFTQCEHQSSSQWQR